MATASNLSSPPPPSLATRSSREVELQQRLTDLCGQASRCIVDSDDAAERATTLAAAIKSQVKALDEDRQTLVRPLNGVVAEINARYKRLVEPADPAIKHLAGPQGQLTLWNARKRREAEEAARRAREEAERVRLEEARRAEEEAARLRAEGDPEAARVAEMQASAALQEAVEVPESIQPKVAATRGTYGGSSSIQRIGKAEVTDIAALLEWELANVRAGRGLQFVAVDQVALGKVARGKDEPKPTVPGVRFFYEESSRVWG